MSDSIEARVARLEVAVTGLADDLQTLSRALEKSNDTNKSLADTVHCISVDLAKASGAKAAVKYLVGFIATLLGAIGVYFQVNRG